MSKKAPYKLLREIPPFIPRSGYLVDVAWHGLEWQLARYKEEFGIDLNPDFQRGHVWTRKQQISYVEHCLRGGESTRLLHWNCHDWQAFSGNFPVVLVDGKQRLTAVLKFLQDKIPAFGRKLSKYKDNLTPLNPSFRFHVNALKTRAEVLRWYLELNEGGTVHTKDELEKVHALLEEEAGGNPC